MFLFSISFDLIREPIERGFTIRRCGTFVGCFSLGKSGSRSVEVVDIERERPLDPVKGVVFEAFSFVGDKVIRNVPCFFNAKEFSRGIDLLYVAKGGEIVLRKFF